MERLAAVLAFVSFCPSLAQQSVGTVVVDDGRIGIGLITGGNFGPGSFSINSSPGGRPNTHVYVQEDDGDTQHIVLQSGQSGGTEPEISEGANSGNTQLYPVQPLTIHTNPGQEDNEGGSGGGQIIIGSVVLNTLKHKHNRGNKPKNGNNIQTDELDSAALEAIFGSNSGNNSPQSTENGLGNAGEQESIQIASITGGNFEKGTLNINNNNKRPATYVPQIGSDVNHGNLNAENEAHDSIGHGGNIQPDALDAAAIETIFGSNGANIGSPSTKNDLSNKGGGGGGGEQESIQIASITGGNFEEGTLNINNNNKRPGTDVPQIGSDVNNGNTGNLHAENEAQYSIGHGANNNDAGTVGGSNQGQANSGGYDEPWIWNR